MRTVVAGAGGAIGGHLVRALLDEGHEVHAFDIKPRAEWWQLHTGAENFSSIDLADAGNAREALDGAQWVYDLADNMGGIGYISSHKVAGAESVEIAISLLRAAVTHRIDRFFFSSSACVYPTYMQAIKGDAPALKENDAWPAQPEEGYGASKLYVEQLLKHYREERGLDIRIARYHNVYGPHGAWNDGREKAPAAICRKVAEAVQSGKHQIEIWGDGSQLRSYMYVTDCVRGTVQLMASAYTAPLNLGSTQSISVDDLVSIVEEIAGVKLSRRYDPTKAQGVKSRNADITQARHSIGWSPKIQMVNGLTRLYNWIFSQVAASSSDGHNEPTATTTSGRPSSDSRG